MPDNHYATLGIRKDAEPEAVRDAYIALARQHHPDVGGNAAVFQQVNTAYSVLRVPTKRAQYDRERALLTPQCTNCLGLGYIETTRGMRGVTRSTCSLCAGTGEASN